MVDKQNLIRRGERRTNPGDKTGYECMLCGRKFEIIAREWEEFPKHDDIAAKGHSCPRS